MSEQFKKIAFLAPKPGMTDEAFRRYWREVHGPLVAASPGYEAYRQRYVQNHIVAAGPLGGSVAFAGMAEFWLPRDNEDDFAATPIYRDRIRVDEMSFIDMDNTVSMSAVETIVKPGHGNAKLVVLSRRLPGLALADFHRAVSSAYVPAVLGAPEVGGRIRGWSVNRVVEGSFRLPGGRMTGALPIDCIEEIWFSSYAEANAAFSSEGYVQAVRPLAQQVFCAQGWQSFLAEELVFFDRGRPVAP